MLSRSRRRLFASLTLAVAIAVLLAACGSDAKKSTSGSPSPGNASDTTGNVRLRLGYFANVTHAPALIGVENGTLVQKLGSTVKLDLKTFNAGSDVVTALLGEALDASFVGPNPAINAFQKTHGAVRVVSGVTSGGAYLVVKPNINSAADLKGKKVATPQLGNTQDVALRNWLNKNGLHESKDGGDVTITPQDNAVTLTAFQQGSIAGAWVPEPWATRLVKEGGGKVLVDEATLWPQGRYTTTVLLVTKKFLDAHPDVVKNLIEGTADAIDLVKTNSTQAQELTNTGIQKVTGKALKPDVIAASFKDLTFTLNPIASAMKTAAENAKSLGFLTSSDIAGLFDLTLLDQVLQARREPAVATP